MPSLRLLGSRNIKNHGFSSARAALQGKTFWRKSRCRGTPFGNHPFGTHPFGIPRKQVSTSRCLQTTLLSMQVTWIDKWITSGLFVPTKALVRGEQTQPSPAKTHEMYISLYRLCTPANDITHEVACCSSESPQKTAFRYKTTSILKIHLSKSACHVFVLGPMDRRFLEPWCALKKTLRGCVRIDLSISF